MSNILTGRSLSGTSVSRERVENDFYETPTESTIALLGREKFSEVILEPCCMNGYISESLKDYGYDVISNDMVDRGYGEYNEDFLNSKSLTADNVITNPPFKYAKEFIEKSLEVTNG